MTRQTYQYNTVLVKCTKCHKYLPTDIVGQTEHNRQWHPVHLIVSKEEKAKAKGMMDAWEDMLLYHEGLTAFQLHEICSAIAELRKLLKGDN